MCAKTKFVQYCYNDRGAPLYSGTPAPSSGLVKANFFVYYDFYNCLSIITKGMVKAMDDKRSRTNDENNAASAPTSPDNVKSEADKPKSDISEADIKSEADKSKADKSAAEAEIIHKKSRFSRHRAAPKRPSFCRETSSAASARG